MHLKNSEITLKRVSGKSEIVLLLLLLLLFISRAWFSKSYLDKVNKLFTPVIYTRLNKSHYITVTNLRFRQQKINKEKRKKTESMK